MKLIELPVFFLDLQTTGAKPENSHILELAWADTFSEGVESRLVQLPEGGFIPRFIKEMTGILDSDLEQAPNLNEVLAEFKSFLQKKDPSSPAVIHFAQFEKPFLDFAFRQSHDAIPFSILCTHVIAKKLFPNLPTRGIKGLAGYYGFVKSDLKRSKSHVEATKMIWRGLVQDLNEKGIVTLEELEHWIKEGPKTKKTKYEYPLAKDKRLKLPKKPGIYRMLSKTSEVLYVGKATCLKDRVNSYFRGQKGRDPKKLEMLTQVWDLDVTECDSPLEAALLETDEIKKLNPRYNVSLKTNGRQLLFYNTDFSSVSPIQNEEHWIGPFSNIWVLDSIIKISKSIKDHPGEVKLSPTTFYDSIDPDLLNAGFMIFCNKHNLDPFSFFSVRKILAQGLYWWRKTKDFKEAMNSEEPIETDLEIEIESDSVTDESLLLEATPEDYAEKFERHFIRAGKNYWRARMMTRLLNAKVEFKSESGEVTSCLRFLNGFLQRLPIQETGSSISPNRKRTNLYWQEHGIETYDRMSILFTEVQKVGRTHRRIIFRSSDILK